MTFLTWHLATDIKRIHFVRLTLSTVSRIFFFNFVIFIKIHSMELLANYDEYNWYLGASHFVSDSSRCSVVVKACETYFFVPAKKKLTLHSRSTPTAFIQTESIAVTFVCYLCFVAKCYLLRLLVCAPLEICIPKYKRYQLGLLIVFPIKSMG